LVCGVESGEDRASLRPVALGYSEAPGGDVVGVHRLSVYVDTSIYVDMLTKIIQGYILIPQNNTNGL
jgi:hypothetical protein